VRHEGFEPPTF